MNAMGACVYGGRLRDAEKTVLELLAIHYSEVLVIWGLSMMAQYVDTGNCQQNCSSSI